ncbi:hypothetical protein Acr_11g0006970 [Actinidia rufa]|uniref:Chromo domain-containing protein n=1 Tax=Actinidia rufa TaxID=165716 RepID=A0A7J0FCJ0_9ERIC|nr:hypothetical protein Acr_11g0006970 [Actinidia rufa]
MTTVGIRYKIKGSGIFGSGDGSVSRTTGRSPLETVTGLPPRKPIDLVPLPVEARPSVEADAFAKHIREIHDEVRRKIAIGNEGLERYPKDAYKKLHSKDAGPCKILKKISSNAHVLDLLDNVEISHVFNVEDVTLYPGHDDNAPDISVVRLPPSLRLKEEIEDVIDHQLLSTNRGGYKKILIKWKGRPLSDWTWITDEEFQRLDHDLYEHFHAFNSPGLRFFKPGKDDGDKWQRSLDVSKAPVLIWHDLDDAQPTWELGK